MAWPLWWWLCRPAFALLSFCALNLLIFTWVFRKTIWVSEFVLLIFASAQGRKEPANDFCTRLGFEQWTCISLSKNWNCDPLVKRLIFMLGLLQNFIYGNCSQTVILNHLSKMQQFVIGLSEMPISLAFTIISFLFLILQKVKRKGWFSNLRAATQLP